MTRFLITAPIDRFEVDVASMREYMKQAFSNFLAGFKLRADVKTVIYPDHFSDKRGVEMLKTVIELL